jgi:hypothetical protein
MCSHDDPLKLTAFEAGLKRFEFGSFCLDGHLRVANGFHALSESGSRPEPILAACLTADIFLSLKAVD